MGPVGSRGHGSRRQGDYSRAGVTPPEYAWRAYQRVENSFRVWYDQVNGGVAQLVEQWNHKKRNCTNTVSLRADQPPSNTLHPKSHPALRLTIEARRPLSPACGEIQSIPSLRKRTRD